jgi:hypothetical protein
MNAAIVDTSSSSPFNGNAIKIFHVEKLFVPMDKYEYLMAEIEKFTTLNRNWDGHGAIPLFPEIAVITSKLLVMLGATFIDKITDVLPNPKGTITIEWENRKGEKLALEIGLDNYSYFISYEDGQPLLVNGHNIFADFKTFAQDLENLLSEEIQKYVFSK